MPQSLASLRQLLADTALDPTERTPDTPHSVFGVPALDRLVRCDLGRSLHIFGADNARHFGHVSGFCLAILSRLAAEGTIVWVTQSLAGLEGGRLHGAGIAEMAMDPARFLYVDAKRSEDVLWAMEESLRSKAVAAVVGEVFDAAAIELTATRRMALKSERTGVPAYMVTMRADPGIATAARTRWTIGPAPSRALAPEPTLVGAPVWSAALIKNRSGPCGEALLGYCPRTRRFFAPPPIGAEDRAPAFLPQEPVGRDGAERTVNSAVVRLAAERRHLFETARRD